MTTAENKVKLYVRAEAERRNRPWKKGFSLALAELTLVEKEVELRIREEVAGQQQACVKGYRLGLEHAKNLRPEDFINITADDEGTK